MRLVLQIENYSIELTEKPVSVYNFQVEDFHTYFVGECGAWVHNAGDYKSDNRVPQDGETVLKSDEFKRTSMVCKGARVYRGSDGRYYYRYTFHTGESAHLEVFSKNGVHLGEADPLTGILIPGTADSAKTLKIK